MILFKWNSLKKKKNVVITQGAVAKSWSSRGGFIAKKIYVPKMGHKGNLRSLKLDENRASHKLGEQSTT